MSLIVLAVLLICPTDAIVMKKEILPAGGIEIDFSIVTHAIAMLRAKVNFYKIFLLLFLAKWSRISFNNVYHRAAYVLEFKKK